MFQAAIAPAWRRSAGGNVNGNISIFAPARSGKTILAMRGLMPIAPGRRVLIIDVKGGDKNLDGVGRVVKRMPSKLYGIAQGSDDRDRVLVLRPDPDEARAVVAHALAQVWHTGKTTVYIDEVRLVADPKYLNLGALLDRLWLFAGSRGVQLVTATQAPRWVPAAMYDQAEQQFIGRVRDKRALRRLAEIVSDVEGVEKILTTLPDHHFLYSGPAGVAIVHYPL